MASEQEEAGWEEWLCRKGVLYKIHKASEQEEAG
jgi:hypothetical protein